MAITYLKGDATNPQTPGNKIIAHICNDIGGWGRGFVLSLGKRWPKAEHDYRQWYQDDKNLPFRLGNISLVQVDNNVYVANMIAQRGIMAKDGIQPIRYDALKRCLIELRVQTDIFADHASIHMPRIGCGLAGGEWSKIEPIILECLNDLDVYVYDYEATGAQHIPWKP